MSGKEYVDPRDFGAVGDGVADDTAAWQAALNHAASTGLPFLATGMRLNVNAEKIVQPEWPTRVDFREPAKLFVAKDGDDYPDDDFLCVCGRGPYRLYWNGGELDDVHCECGLWYYGRQERVALRVDRVGPYAD